MFFCFLYYIFRPKAAASSGNANKMDKTKDKVHKMAKKVDSSVGNVLINQMQVLAVILSTVQWNPRTPQWLVSILVFLGNVFSVDMGGFLSSPDCVASMDPLPKWLFQLALPWLLASLFLLWYGLVRIYFVITKKYDSTVVETVLHSGVQVLLIGLYTTVVKKCFQIFDCTASTDEAPSVLIMDPTHLCSEVIGYQVVGALVFILWAVLPFFIISIRLTRYKSNGTLATVMKESVTFRILYGWAIKKYVVEESRVAYLWEVFNAATKILMTAGSVMLYGPPTSNNRTILQTATIGLSLICHGCIRPYKDVTSNRVVITFCIVDLLGIFSTGNGPFIQLIYIGTSFTVLLFVLILALKAIRATMKEELMKEHMNTKSDFTRLETILLCPFLIGVVWPLKKAIRLVRPISLSSSEAEWMKNAPETKLKVSEADKQSVLNWEFGEEKPKGSKSSQQTASTKRASKGGQTKVLPIRPKVKVDFRKPRKIFQQFDKNKDDALDREEVLDALQTIGCSMNKESFDAMFSDCDKNKDGGIDYKEFKKTM